MTGDEKNLIRRYLFWCYKTTKEEFERIERKFTQLKVDHAVLLELMRKNLKIKDEQPGREYLQLVEEFKGYIKNKEAEAFKLKFAGNPPVTFLPRYVYLRNRLAAIEKTAVFFLGPKEFRKIAALYEKEMIQRILAAREHT